jgi:hypothetical protein
MAPAHNEPTVRPIGASEILTLLPPLLFVGFGAVLIAIGVSSYRRTKATETWPSTQGNVYATNIRRYNDEGTIRFAPEINYEYTVGGELYKSTVIREEIFVSFPDEDEARRFLKNYMVGRSVQVFYDPTNPNQSVLEPKAAPVLHMVTIMGVISCCFAAMMYYLSFRKLRKRYKRIPPN